MDMDLYDAYPGSAKDCWKKVPAEVPPTKVLSFTFVPVVKKLPLKSEVIPKGKSGHLSSKSDENLGDFKEKAAEENMSEDGVFRAEIVYIGDSDEGETERDLTDPAPDDISTEQEAQAQFKMPADHMTPGQPPTHTEIPAHNFINRSPTPRPVVWETINNNNKSVPWPYHEMPLGVEVASGLFLKKAADKSERMTSVDIHGMTKSPELFETPASSKESLLSEDWGGPKSWSALRLFTGEGSSVSASRTVSPCSSVRSGVFSPAVVRVKSHSLVTGSSLMEMPISCFSSTDSLVTAPSPLSPRAGRPKHRPPPTQLSLLTAILRKGRLPVLSTSLQRPYTPCWPISPSSLSSCNACSAASSLTSICQVSGLQSPHNCAEKPLDPASHMHRPLSESILPPTPAHACISNEQQLGRSPKCPSHQNLVEPSRRLTSPNTQIKAQSQSAPPGQVKMASPNLRNLQKIINTNDSLPVVHSQALSSSFSRLSSLCPKPSSSSRLTSENFRTPSPLSRETPVPGCMGASSLLPVQNGITVAPVAGGPYHRSLTCRPSPPPRASPLLPSPCPSLLSLGSPSPRSDSPPPAPERLAFPPFAAPPHRHLLTPSPSCSLSSTPSPTPLCGSSELSADREGKKRKPYKIKSSYKALAAIPTNTILLEQQAIDEHIEKEDNPLDSTGWHEMLETHAEMCSPAQFRQQSEELYAELEKVLEDPIPMHRSKSAPVALSKLVDTEPSKQFTSLQRSAGRETKYATFHLQPTGSPERNLTRPGVIRPATVIPKLPEEDTEEMFQPNPFKQYLEEMSNNEQHKLSGGLLGLRKKEDGDRNPETQQMFVQEKIPAKGKDILVPQLLITEEEESNSPLVKDGSLNCLPSAFNNAQVKTDIRETHI